MSEMLMGTEVSSPAGPGRCLTFEEIVDAFCKEQAEIRAWLDRAGRARGSDPLKGSKTALGPSQGGS